MKLKKLNKSFKNEKRKKINFNFNLGFELYFILEILPNKKMVNSKICLISLVILIVAVNLAENAKPSNYCI